MLDFNIKHITSTFNSSQYYNGDINGADIMIMQSHEDADKLIKELKHIIDSYQGNNIYNLNIEYDDKDLLEIDKIRVKQTIEKYILQKTS